MSVTVSMDEDSRRPSFTFQEGGRKKREFPSAVTHSLRGGQSHLVDKPPTKRRYRTADRTDKDMDKIVLSILVRAVPESWDSCEKTLHTPLGTMDLTSKQYDAVHKLWSRFIWQKVPLATNPDELANKLDRLSSPEGTSDVYREYMRDVNQSNNNAYFENFEPNDNRTQQLKKRAPEDLVQM